jgi:hypothetical protein
MRLLAALVAVACGWTAAAQDLATDPVTVSTEHPRLLLRPQRLRLLRREKERNSPRWEQFAALVDGNAPLPEPGFALALHYQVAGNREAGRKAIAFALGPSADVRQQAFVFDWCQDLLTEAERAALTTRLERAIGAPPEAGVAATRSRVLAAIALFDHVEGAPQKELERVVRQWWLGQTVPALNAGKSPISREDAYPLFELLHAMRDNTILDLREPVGQFFKDYPIEHLMSYYPAVYEGADTNYYIGASRTAGGEPDLKAAALSRAGELAMVAYDTNAAPSQVLQGWLMHDKFMLRGTFGAPYEFLWANPYLPGLSYYHVPLVYHNPDFGKLFIRSSWDDGATWFGAFDGVTQLFEDGRLKPPGAGPLSLDQAVVCFAMPAGRFTVKPGEDEDAVFVVGLEPHKTYEVEIDDEEMFEAAADPGGILELQTPKGRTVGIRVRPAGAAGSQR